VAAVEHGADFCVEALEEALAWHGKPEIFNMDGKSLPQRRRGAAVWTTSSSSGLWRSLKYEEVYLHAGACPRAGRRPDPWASAAEAKAGIGSWLRFYNEERQHQSLGYRTPRQVHHRKGHCADRNRGRHRNQPGDT